MPRIYKREAAKRDLVERLAGQPSIGAPLKLREPNLAGLRKWRVKKFDTHLIFYLPLDDGVSIVRVLQAAQD